MVDLPVRNPAFHTTQDYHTVGYPAMNGTNGSSSIFGDLFGGIADFAEGAANAAESVFGSLSAYEAAKSEYDNPTAQVQAAEAKKTQQYILLGVGVLALILILK